MNSIFTKTLASGAIAILGLVAAIATPAQAGTIYGNWNYSIDSNIDGSGGAAYNYKGLAVTETADKVIFALSNGLNYDQNSSANLTHGDLFLNFSGGDFASANGTDSLLAIKFATKNDTTLATGLYKTVTGGDLNNFAAINHAGHNYNSMKQYYDYGWGFDGSAGGTAVTNTYGTDLATKKDVYNYFYSDTVAASPTQQNTPFMNAIQSGTKVGDISMLDQATLNGQYGLDFGHFNAVGSSVFGIAIDKALLKDALPGGINSFMAHLILECGNDGVALAGGFTLPEDKTADVPEPTILFGLSVFGLALRRKRA